MQSRKKEKRSGSLNKLSETLDNNYRRKERITNANYLNNPTNSKYTNLLSSEGSKNQHN
jgi:hypothetical protein